MVLDAHKFVKRKVFKHQFFYGREGVLGGENLALHFWQKVKGARFPVNKHPWYYTQAFKGTFDVVVVGRGIPMIQDHGGIGQFIFVVLHANSIFGILRQKLVDGLCVRACKGGFVVTMPHVRIVDGPWDRKRPYPQWGGGKGCSAIVAVHVDKNVGIQCKNALSKRDAQGPIAWHNHAKLAGRCQDSMEPTAHKHHRCNVSQLPAARCQCKFGDFIRQ